MDKAQRVVIDRERCIGSGNCAFWLPEVFGLDDDDVAIVVDPDGGPWEKIVELSRACPTQAIIIEETEEKS